LRGGVIALAWTDVVGGAANPSDGRNVVFHEFAHALDMADGAVEGTPPLPTREAEEAWTRTLQREFDALRQQYEAGYGIPLDPYGLTNLAEFLAVSTESYLERPRLLQLKLPTLYALLDSFYRLQPASW
jgi:Mlc titration factor MtfA (ptsG expression regulator)